MSMLRSENHNSDVNSKYRDTGMAMVLLCLIAAYLFGPIQLYIAAIVLQILTMTIPAVFKPLSGLWFGLSNVLGYIVSNIILIILFYIVVTPIALIRRLMGADALKIREWKKNHHSAFKVRDKVYTADDLRKPY